MGLAERGEAASEKWGKRMPKQKPGKSVQSVATPKSLIDAIEYRFGPLVWDLAASHDNAKCENYITLDEPLPRSPATVFDVICADSLTVDWHKLSQPCFLNPEYNAIGVWAKKCYTESLLGAKIFLLVPLTCSKWYCDWILGKAYEIKLRERVTFETHNTPYPKDLCLYWYNCGIRGSECWSWKTTLAKHNGKVST